VQFLVVINPNSGPNGNATLKDPNFLREIPRLNAISNVRTIGYVRTGWGTRNETLILDDVNTYASWANFKVPGTNDTFELHGIFYDEAPNNYTASGQAVMNNIDAFVKNHTGFNGVNFVHLPRSFD
jgi:Spherulation-specific family 4